MEIKPLEISQYYKDLLYFINHSAMLSNRKITFPDEINPLRPFHRENFTPIQNNIIVRLYVNGPMNISEIAATEHLVHSTASRTVDGLVKRGFLHRFHKDENRKTVFVELTEYGKNVYIEDMNVYAAYMVSKMEAVTDEAGRRKFLEAYKYISEMLEKF